jgi:hypothetical protein
MAVADPKQRVSGGRASVLRITRATIFFVALGRASCSNLP